MTERIVFKPKSGARREGVLAPGFVTEDKVKVLLDGDPFPVDVPRDQVSAPGQNDSVKVESRKVPKSGTKKKSKKKKGRNAKMTTDSKPSGKELRQQAQALGIKGWEDMGRDKLAKKIEKRLEKEKVDGKSKPADKPAPAAKAKKPVPAKKAPAVKKAAPKAKSESETPKAKPAAKKAAPAKKAVAKKAAPAPKKAAAPAKKTTAKKAAPAPKKATPAKKPQGKKGPKRVSNGPLGPKADAFGVTLSDKKPEKKIPKDGANPYRKDSGLFHCANLLLKGGSRRKMAEALSKKVDINPYVHKKKEINLDDYDKRLILAAGSMRDTFGYGVQRVGRGIDGKVLVFVPGGPNDPRTKGTKNAKAPAKKAAPKAKKR